MRGDRVSFLAPGLMIGGGGVGLDGEFDAGSLSLERGPRFMEWLTSPLELADGRTVGEANRASLHAWIDEWLDG